MIRTIPRQVHLTEHVDKLGEGESAKHASTPGGNTPEHGPLMIPGEDTPWVVPDMVDIPPEEVPTPPAPILDRGQIS